MAEVQTAQITIAYVNPPKPNKTNGSVKTKEGTYYGVPPNLLDSFKPGGTYSVDYTSKSFNGQTYMTVNKVTLVAPPPGQGGGKSYGRGDDNVVAERIFVCGALNAAIQGGHVAMMSEDITNTVEMLRAVWEKTFGKAAPKPAVKNDDMDDSIPF